MRYRATLHGVDESSHTQRQCHSGYRHIIEAWADSVLAKINSPIAYVQIEEQSYTVVRTIRKETPVNAAKA